MNLFSTLLILTSCQGVKINEASLRSHSKSKPRDWQMNVHKNYDRFNGGDKATFTLGGKDYEVPTDDELPSD